MKRQPCILAHVSIILSIMFIVFLILDQFNRAMNFLSNGISSVLLAVLCVVSMINAIVILYQNYQRNNRR